MIDGISYGNKDATEDKDSEHSEQSEIPVD